MCGAGRLEKYRSTRHLWLGRLEETEIERFTDADAHRPRQTQFSRCLRVLHEYRQTVHQQRLRYAIHYRTQHRVQADLVGQSLAEFDQCSAIVQTVAVEKMIQAPLDPHPNGLKEK